MLCSWAQVAKVTANDAKAHDRFGAAVHINDGYAIVGSHPYHEGGKNSGAAYIFAHTSNNWVQQARLSASDGTNQDSFGNHVAIYGSYAVVAAHGADDWGTSWSGKGAAYIFELINNTWSQQSKLSASDGGAQDQFGKEVGISGVYVVVGSDQHNGKSGCAYVFVQSSSTWEQQAKLTASDSASNDYFGRSVGISGKYVVIGAWNEDAAGAAAGAAYLFKRVGGAWEQQTKLTASSASEADYFGWSVRIDGNSAAVAAYSEDSAGDQSGSVYMFEQSSNVWTEQAQLMASDPGENDHFGHSISMSHDQVVVGSYYADTSGMDAGSAYVFKFSEGTWAQHAKLVASDGDVRDNFGVSVGVSGRDVVVGAYFDEHATLAPTQAPTSGCCDVKIAGAEAVQPLSMGLFSRLATAAPTTAAPSSFFIQDDRPVFQNSAGQYLSHWVSADQWRVGPDISPDISGQYGLTFSAGVQGMAEDQYSSCPSDVTDWQPYTNDVWSSGYPITVVCATISPHYSGDSNSGSAYFFSLTTTPTSTYR